MPPWSQTQHAHESDLLTPREVEVLALVADGLSTPDIAMQLRITSGTVKSHLTNVYKKLGVRNRVQATRHYLDYLAAS
jgi:DNA-binding NarL/FixJ family response regulator